GDLSARAAPFPQAPRGRPGAVVFGESVPVRRRIAARSRRNPGVDARGDLCVLPPVARPRAATNADRRYDDRRHRRAYDDALRALLARAARAFETAAALRRQPGTSVVLVRRHPRSELRDRDAAGNAGPPRGLDPRGDAPH